VLSVRKDERLGGGQRSKRIDLTVETSANARSLTTSDNIGRHTAGVVTDPSVYVQSLPRTLAGFMPQRGEPTTSESAFGATHRAGVMFSPAIRQQRYSRTQLQMIDPRMISQNGSMPVKSQLATLGPRLPHSNIASATREIQLESEVSFAVMVNEPGSKDGNYVSLHATMRKRNASDSAYYSPGEGAAGQAKRLKARSKTGYKGVRANGKRWQAQIYYDSEQHHIGTYDTKPEAALAYSDMMQQQEL
jgi:hypothetical protein